MLRTARRLAASSLAAAAAACSAPDADPLAGLRVLQGSWTGTHRVLGDESMHAARYVIRSEGGTLVWEFESDFSGGFTGRGVQHWNPLHARILESWTDSSAPGREWILDGAFDRGAGILVMRGEDPAADGGAPTVYLHTTRIRSRDAWSYVMTMTSPGEEPLEVVWIEMRRD
jgi:hypothetical protein